VVKGLVFLCNPVQSYAAATQLSHWQNKNKMVFSTEDLVLIKVLCQGKGYNHWWI